MLSGFRNCNKNMSFMLFAIDEGAGGTIFTAELFSDERQKGIEVFGAWTWLYEVEDLQLASIGGDLAVLSFLYELFSRNFGLRVSENPVFF